MLERFTERARQVVVLASDEARSLHHNYLGTEHLLLGLLREEQGIAARVLAGLGVELDAVRSRVAQIAPSDEAVPGGEIPLTPRSKRVLELALREALSLGHNYIGTEHVLLGLVRENEGVATAILLKMGADASTIRDAVIRALSGSAITTTVVPARAEKLQRRAPLPVALLVAGWLLFAVALGVGVLVGWAIWG